MDIELLRTFLEVKNTRHFGKAAENLYLTQAAVSARIKQLETILDGPLFTRFRNNLQLTVTGERLVHHAETILLAWERARQDVALKKRQRHVLALGATSGLWDLIMQDALLSLHDSHPDLAMRAEAHGPDTLIRHLMERTLDMALIYEPAKLSDLESRKMASTELILVSTRPKLSTSEALGNGFVAVDWGLSFQIHFAQTFPDAGPAVLHTTLARIALDFILKYGGSAFLPRRMVGELLGNRLHSVDNAPSIPRDLFACYHRENTHTEEIEAVIATLESLAR